MSLRHPILIPLLPLPTPDRGNCLAENDDNGDGVNSRVRLAGGPDWRDIVVKVSSFDAALLAAGERFGGNLDPLIEVGFATPMGWALMTSDGDGGGQLNAVLPLDLHVLDAHPALLDMLRIRVQGLGEAGGDYTLIVRPGITRRPGGVAVEDALEDGAPVRPAS